MVSTARGGEDRLDMGMLEMRWLQKIGIELHASAGIAYPNAKDSLALGHNSAANPSATFFGLARVAMW